jgi:two-component system, OmpR family, sensor kinase
VTHPAIRVRLALAFSAVMVLVLAATGLLVYLRVGGALDRTLRAELRSQAAQVESGLRSGESPPWPAPNEANGETFAQVLDGHGQVTASDNEDWRRPVLSTRIAADVPARGMMFDASPPAESDERWRILAVSTPDHRIVVVGRSRREHDEALATLRTQLLIGGVIALVLATLAGFRLAGAALRPVESMRRRAADISASTTGHRLPVPRSDDEVSRLGETLNDMLERLDAALAHERAFVANASHQLRTPLARLKAELESAVQRERSPTEYQEVLHAAIQETDRLAQLARDLLALARAEQGDTARRSPLRVGTVFAHVADRFATRARTDGRRVGIGEGADLIVLADEVQLEHALGNVVDNALRYGAGPVRMSAIERPPVVELHVTDEGPGIPDSFLPRAFDRFSRADTGRDDGSGLGLAIVQMIAQAHDGTASVRNRPTGGADVLVSIPSHTRSFGAAPAAAQASVSGQLESSDHSKLGVKARMAASVRALVAWLVRHRRLRRSRPRNRPTAR